MRTNEENGIKDEAIMIVIEWEEEDRGGGGAALRMRTYEENGVAHEAIVIMGGQMSQNSIIITAAFQCIYRTSYL